MKNIGTDRRTCGSGRGAVLGAALGAMLVGAVLGGEFEIVALVDHLDFAKAYDIETPTGIVQCLEHVLRTHATDVWWRDKSGGKMRYPGGVEGWPLGEAPFQKARLPCEDIWGHLRLDAPRAQSLPLVREECIRRGVRFGIHTTTEENHWCSQLASTWTLAHPEYWGCTRGGVPFMGCASIGHPEVVEHKLAMVDERLAHRPGTICLDTFRHGDWSAAREYTPLQCARWRERHGCEPPDAKDPRWQAFVGEQVKAYYRAFAAKCRAAGTRFVLGVTGIDGKGDAEAAWKSGVDWRELAADGTLDAVYVMNVKFDPADPMGSTERLYGYVMRNRGKADVYFPLTQYNFTDRGLPGYAKALKVSVPEATGRLLRLAMKAGGRGVVMECVDHNNYTDEMCGRIEKEMKK